MGQKYLAIVNLSENILCSGVKNQTQDFQIITTPGDGFQRIIGINFKFNYDGNSECANVQLYASQLADFYLDFISAVTHQIAQKLYFTIELFDSNNNYICTARHDRMNPVLQPREIDMSQFKRAIDKPDTQKKQLVRHYYSGVMFLMYRMPEFAIREFFKIIEGKHSISGYENYRLIRDFFSHNIIAVHRASKEFLKSSLKDEFTYTMEGKMIVIDVYNPSNRLELNHMASELMNKSKELVFG
jgi:hypothetical protein